MNFLPTKFIPKADQIYPRLRTPALGCKMMSQLTLDCRNCSLDFLKKYYCNVETQLKAFLRDINKELLINEILQQLELN